MTLLEQVIAIVIGTEGALSLDQDDPGNWTGGAVGKGALHGTKWGISAAAYPGLDIASLTQAQAAAIYQRDYWARLACDVMPPVVALVVFDAAVNSGVGQSARWLQDAIGTVADGIVGPATQLALKQAVDRMGADGLAAELLARRIVFLAGTDGWRRYSLGWARRLFRLPWQAQTLKPDQQSPLAQAA